MTDAGANPTSPRLSLTLGPVLFLWDEDRWRDFYFQIADEADVDTVVIGEANRSCLPQRRVPGLAGCSFVRACLPIPGWRCDFRTLLYGVAT